MRRAATETGDEMRQTTFVAFGYASWLERIVNTTMMIQFGGES